MEKYIIYSSEVRSWDFCGGETEKKDSLATERWRFCFLGLKKWDETSGFPMLEKCTSCVLNDIMILLMILKLQVQSFETKGCEFVPVWMVFSSRWTIQD